MDNVTKLAKLIGATLGLFPNQVKALLLKNKVIIDSNISNKEMLSYTLDALDKTPSFFKDFEKLFNDNEQTILKNI